MPVAEQPPVAEEEDAVGPLSRGRSQPLPDRGETWTAEPQLGGVASEPALLGKDAVDVALLGRCSESIGVAALAGRVLPGPASR